MIEHGAGQNVLSIAVASHKTTSVFQMSATTATSGVPRDVPTPSFPGLWPIQGMAKSRTWSWEIGAQGRLTCPFKVITMAFRRSARVSSLACMYSSHFNRQYYCNQQSAGATSGSDHHNAHAKNWSEVSPKQTTKKMSRACLALIDSLMADLSGSISSLSRVPKGTPFLPGSPFASSCSCTCGCYVIVLVQTTTFS